MLEVAFDKLLVFLNHFILDLYAIDSEGEPSADVDREVDGADELALLNLVLFLLHGVSHIYIETSLQESDWTNGSNVDFPSSEAILESSREALGGLLLEEVEKGGISSYGGIIYIVRGLFNIDYPLQGWFPIVVCLTDSLELAEKLPFRDIRLGA